ncbi:PEBP-like protein [Russula earlei]|uniref:PEBP-like protein n=1 Tax=Russula earlei TaxID=71964 RepID=A0ACC0UG09_9AGAM|nr:PEBP-like protein [Russula earlei]
MLNLWILLLPGLLVTALPLGAPGDTNLAQVRQTFEQFNIPANASLSFNPIVLLEVAFPQPGAAVSAPVSAGEQIPQNVTAGPPEWALHSNGLGSADTGFGPFVLAVADLDVPTPQAPSSSQYRHFLGGGFYLGKDGLDVTRLVNNTPAISEFVQPNPPQGSDPHRYVFLVFKEPPSFSNQTLVDSSTSRLSFNVSAFAIATGLGDPLGGTFILVGPPTA